MPELAAPSTGLASVGAPGAAPVVRHAEPLVSEGRKMSRPNDEGHRANGTPETTQNEQRHFDNESDASKALAWQATKARGAP